jgi:hypothetical protein
MNHRNLRWNPGTQEWFCGECGQTSDHVTVEDVGEELNQRDCKVPSVDLPKGRDDPST